MLSGWQYRKVAMIAAGEFEKAAHSVEMSADYLCLGGICIFFFFR